jgi:anti-sigma regulatory factor (Ser/Thr protein kinase)
LQRRGKGNFLPGMPEYRARFGSALENVAAARRAVVEFAAHWFDDRDVADIESAVGEALANSAEHGAKSGGEVDVRCHFDGDRFIIDVKDTGDGFDRWNAADYVKPFGNATRGYGIYIMRELMDEVEYSDHGTRLRLIKRLPVRPAAAEQAEQA